MLLWHGLFMMTVCLFQPSLPCSVAFMQVIPTSFFILRKFHCTMSIMFILNKFLYDDRQCTTPCYVLIINCLRGQCI